MNYVCVNRYSNACHVLLVCNDVCSNTPYRLAQWFAYHLSNYKYQWDWQLW